MSTSGADGFLAEARVEARGASQAQTLSAQAVSRPLPTPPTPVSPSGRAQFIEWYVTRRIDGKAPYSPVSKDDLIRWTEEAEGLLEDRDDA